MWYVAMVPFVPGAASKAISIPMKRQHERSSKACVQLLIHEATALLQLSDAGNFNTFSNEVRRNAGCGCLSVCGRLMLASGRLSVCGPSERCAGCRECCVRLSERGVCLSERCVWPPEGEASMFSSVGPQGVWIPANGEVFPLALQHD